MGISKEIWRERHIRRFMKQTKYMEWEENRRMSGHRRRLQTMKAAVDNQAPNMGPRTALEQKKERLGKDKLHQLDASNLRFLRRLRAVKERKPGSLWGKKILGLMRGDAFSLKKPSCRLQKMKGPLAPPYQSKKKLRDEVAQKVISLQDMDDEGEKQLRRWMSGEYDVPVEFVDYSRTSSPRTPAMKEAPPAKMGAKKEVFKEPEPENLAPASLRSKLSLKGKLPPPAQKWEWDATPPAAPKAKRWQSTPLSERRWNSSPRTPSYPRSARC